MIKAILCYVCFSVFLYFLGAFVAWDLNAGNWETVGRVAVSVAMIFSIPIFVAIAIAFEEK